MYNQEQASSYEPSMFLHVSTYDFLK